MEKVREWIEDNRKYSIYIGLGILIFVLIISIFFLKIGFNKNKKKYVQYSDGKNLEYKVMLKQNEYYKNPYLEKGNQYIANLIDYINTEFKYSFNLDHEYNYKYKIVGNIEVLDEKTNKTIYTSSEDLLGEKTGKIEGNLDINENLNIDFNKYNNLIKQFVTSYDLKNVTSKLNVDLKVSINGTEEKFSKQNFTAMSLEIPLANNTIAIDTNYDLTDNNNLIEIKKSSILNIVCLVIGLLLLAIDITGVVILVIYIKKTETDEDRYNTELRRIVNNYDSYISRVEDDFNMKGYQILKVQKFTDLLEIRDTMQLPIIMLENKEKLITCFAIPTPSKILYFYSISVKQYALASGKNNEEKEVENVDEQKV